MDISRIADFSTTLIGAMQRISTGVGALTASDQPSGLGTKRTAAELGMLPSPRVMLAGYTIYLNGLAILEVRDTEHGRGVFTLVPFRRHMDVMLARGQVLLSSESQTDDEMRYTWSRHPAAPFVFSQFVEARANIVRLINSSQAYGVANCRITWVADGMVPMVTMTRNVDADVQLLIDYQWN